MESVRSAQNALYSSHDHGRAPEDRTRSKRHDGQARHRRSRVPVETIVRQFAASADMAWVLKGFPDLSEEDVRAALAYAAE